ncbi:MAG: hypothetical protein LQ343_001020 [Gyalolechia ehrenbergii]|nr:MAG: hypothetical protein LQ343_001020 [Gyalolechia ehrenbergii]
MATVAAAPITPAEEDTGWNEAQIESALGRLQEMHVQLRHLRDALSRLVDPMLIHQPSPEDLYTIFATNVTTIRSDVEDFANALRDERHKEILKQAHESRIQSDEDIRGWRVTEHEDWFDVHNVDSPRNLEADGTKGSDPDAAQRVTIDSERLHAVIEQFKNVNPGIEVSLDEDTRLIRVSLPPQAYTHFEIHEQPSHGCGSAYNVTTTEKTSMHAAIVKAISSNERTDNVDYLFVGLKIPLKCIS